MNNAGRHEADLRSALAVAMIALLAGIVASGCGSSADTAVADDAPIQRGGEIVVGMDQEPQCLNTLIQCGGTVAARMIWDAMFEGMLAIDAEGNYAPQIGEYVPTAENGKVVVKPDGTMEVTSKIRSAARWSDGTPITCADVRFRWTTIMDDRWTIVSRKGWDLITDVRCPDRLTVVHVFEETYAPYLTYVGAAPLPAHILAGKDFNSYFNFSIPIASGPFAFERWDRSVTVVLKRNDNYWNAGADDKPYLDGMRYVFVADTNTLKIQLRTGEVDVINPPPDSTLSEELATFPRSTFEVEPSTSWEHIAFNNAKPPFDDINVRKAVAHSIDREEIADIVLRGQVKPLQSTLLPEKEEFYVPAWEIATADDAKAQEHLEKSGWTRGATYYEKNGQPLTIVFKTTAGNNLRMKVAQLLQERLRKNGMKLEIVLEPPNVFFGQSTIQGAYDMALWAFTSGIDPSQAPLFSCDSIPSEANDYEGQNNYRYCNERVSELLRRSDVTTDLDERIAIVKEIQTRMAADMPLLPLYQRPETLAWTNRMRNMDNNPLGGIVWNVADWAVVQ